ncbi:TIR domain-containing protein [Streptomyces sp. NPDC006516]|uniref:TIR domain-containing protein n=1 Tax=Streptomyces sp. NPDC006516 TaxID=3154309 RepID=UPI0033B184E9
MRYFVSYARRDSSIDLLCKVRALLCGDECDVYIDDLEEHGSGVDRLQVVIDALNSADIFVALESRHYLTTDWTRWEFETAVRMKTEMVAFSSDLELMRPNDPRWPWSAYVSVGDRAPVANSSVYSGAKARR